MLNPVALNLVDTQYRGSALSLDGYLKANKDKCTNRIAEQMLKLSKEKNKDFLTYTKAIGVKLKQIDSRCNYFRFELIDYVENGIMSMRFAYRCYATANATLPYQRVSHIDPSVINPGMFYKDEDLMKEKCDALAITKGLSAKPAKSMKSNDAPEASEESRATSTKKAPVNNSKKSSVFN